MNDMAWSYNSDYLFVATGKDDGGVVEVMSLNEPTLSAIDTLYAHTGISYCLRIDPTYRKLAVGAADSLVTLWSLDELYCYKSIGGLE